MAALVKMPGHPRLFRRGSTYYHRASIPADIKATYPKTEETFTLGTKDHREAVIRVRVAAAEVDAKFEAHRRMNAAQRSEPVDELSPEQIKRLKDAYYHHLLEEDEEVRLDGFEEIDDEGNLVSEQQFEPRPTFEEREEVVADMNEVNRYNLARGKQDPFHRSEAEEVLSWDGVKLAEGSLSWPRLVRALLEAHVQAAEAIAKRNRGEVVETPAAPLSEPLSVPRGPLLSEHYRSRKAEAERSGRWGPKISADYETWVNLFIEVAGDRPVLDYAKEDARRFKETLLGLPSNRQKHPATRGRTAAECVEIAERLSLERLNTNTINKALARLQALWVWANRQFDEEVADIFGPMKLDAQGTARDERDPFSSEHLALIFHGPLFTGCFSERRRSEPGSTNLSGTSWFWLPLLGLYTGARLNELCQLRLEDVREEHGVRYLDIAEGTEDQRVKGNKKRVVPLHPSLMEIGFWRYIEARRKNRDDRVFPSLKLDASGYYSDRSSKDFAQYIKRVGAKTAKTSFHSLRHNFRDACIECEVSDDIAKVIQGHARGGMSDRYGSGKVSLQRLAGEMEKIAYPAIDLSRICNFEA